MKKSLQEALSSSRENFIKALQENPRQWEIDKENVYNGQIPVRLFLETRKDNQNPETIVLMLDKKEIEIEDIADSVYERIVVENRHTPLNVMEIISNAKSGNTQLNSEMYEGLFDYTNNLKTLRSAVIESPKINLLTFEEVLVEKGYDSRKIFEIKNNLITLGEQALLLNTDEEGKSPLLSAKHVINHITTEQCRTKLEAAGEVYKVLYAQLDEAKLIDLPKKKTHPKR